MAYAEVTDVVARWGHTPTDEETALITIRLADVERLIERGLKKRGLTDLADRIAADLTDEEDVKQVEAEAVLRLVRNPEGFVSETDGNYTYMLAQGATPGRLEILPEEWETLGVYTSLSMFTLVPNVVLPT